MIGERSGVTSTMPPQLRSMRMRRTIGNSSQIASSVWDGDVQSAGLRVGGVGVRARADDEFALVGLRHVGVDRVRHHHAGHYRLHRLGDQRLQRVAFQRHANTGHRHDNAGVTGRDDADLLGADRAAAGLQGLDRARARRGGCRSPRSSG